MASVKKHPTVRFADYFTLWNVATPDRSTFFLSFQLIPLYFCIVLGGCGAFLYTLRLATRSPDVSWLNKKEAEPWNDYKDKMYKVPIIAICRSKAYFG